MQNPGLSNQITDPRPPAVRRLIVGKTQTGVSTGTNLNLTWKVPEGYNRVTGIYFNPDTGRQINFKLYSENVTSNILQDFDSAIGTAMGFVNPDHRYAERDQISLTGSAVAITGGPVSITVSLQFEYVPPGE